MLRTRPMRRSLLLPLAAALLAGSLVKAPRVDAQSVSTFNAGSIAVSGTGEDQITPDRARLSLGVQTQAATAADASQQNARLQSAVLEAVRAQGVTPDQITTSGYSVTPVTEYNQQTRRTRITGYSVENTVTVELRRVDQVGPVLDAVLARGANTVSSLQFYSSQAEASRRRALARAVERARADAEAMATAAGGRLGELVELSSSTEPRPRPVFMAAMARSAAPDATPISEGTETTTATVSARWRFVSNQ